MTIVTFTNPNKQRHLYNDDRWDTLYIQDSIWWGSHKGHKVEPMDKSSIHHYYLL